MLLQRGWQQVEFGKNVVAGISCDRFGRAAPSDRQRAAAPGPVESESRYLLLVDVPVPMLEQPFYRRFPTAPGNQQLGVALQQQPLIANRKAAAGDDGGRIRQ